MQDPPEEESAPIEAPSSNVTIHRDLTFGTFNAGDQSHNLLLDLYLPQDVGDQPIPLIVYIHGGGWFEGGRESCPGNTFASHGYAVACV
jgi:acetyl esterase/lipase